MNPGSPEHIAGLVRDVLRLPASERAAYLDTFCPNEAVRREVESRLTTEERATIAPESTDPALFESSPAESEPAPRPGKNAARRLGKYTVLHVLGEGGMGVVYLAEQERPKRTIALKVVRPGLLTPRMLRRFEHESQILGRLQHPGIAQVYEAGTADTGAGPQPYFAMEYVKGVSLNDYAASRGLTTRQRLELFIQVCDAVHHAHQKGVIHRDLKPGNILVDSEGRPKVLDFGVARATDADEPSPTMQTEVGAVVGTLPYMSPEQLSGDPLAVDTRSDVYALGVILYELLAGRLPLPTDRKTLPEVVRMLSAVEPTPLGAIDRRFRGDLQTIAAKALEKNKDRRYQSASELAADLLRFLRNEPIAARPPSTVYQLQKFAVRNKAVVVGVTAVFLALIGGIIGISWQANRAAEEAEISREVSGFMDQMLRAVNPEEAQGREPTLRELLDSAAAGLESRRGMNPRVELAIRDTIGHTYHAMSRYDEAERDYTRILALARELFSESSRQVFSARRNLASLWAERGKYAEAEEEINLIIEASERTFGKDDPETVFAQMELGRVYQETGRWDQAEPMLRRAVEIGRTTVGDTDQRFITALHNMGTAIKDSGRIKESIGLLREALRLREKTLGPNHPDTLYSMNNLAASLQKSDDPGAREEAESLMRTTLEARTRVLGADHVATITTTGNLAVALVERKQYEEALPLAEKAYNGWRATLGDDHPKTMIGGGNLAYLYEDIGRDTDAEELYRRVINSRKKAAGGQDPETWVPMNNLGMLLARTGKLAEAEAQYRELLVLCASKLPPDHLYFGIFRNNLGECLTLAGKYADAEKELLESHVILETKAGPTHARTNKAIERLAALYDRKNDPTNAAVWREKLPKP
ncbi:eukaryotic-like serine/threonine-protein kinase [Phycisphaerales bacterium]|nr:eukaryotic-like serine/threonine-protein kinase [Phycisphaerales bacterium]